MSLNGDSSAPAPTMMSPGMHVQPGPMTLAVASQVDVSGNKAVVLHIEHSTGNNRFVLTTDMARVLSGMLMKEATGIQVARDLPPQL